MARLLGGRFAVPAGGAQSGGERKPGVGMMEKRVGRCGDVDRGTGKLDCTGVLATP
jgi:hypothetical protein